MYRPKSRKLFSWGMQIQKRSIYLCRISEHTCKINTIEGKDTVLLCTVLWKRFWWKDNSRYKIKWHTSLFPWTNCQLQLTYIWINLKTALEYESGFLFLHNGFYGLIFYSVWKEHHCALIDYYKKHKCNPKAIPIEAILGFNSEQIGKHHINHRIHQQILI